jgi:cytosine/uracil/thiamine/allantoin permease
LSVSSTLLASARDADSASRMTEPISNHLPGLAGSDFSWALGIIVSSLVYWALAARSVRKEAEATAVQARC